MEVYQKESMLYSPAVQRLVEFMQERSEKRASENDVSSEESFESYEQEVHKLVMAVERELVGEELSRYDMNAKEIEVAGKEYRRGVRYPESYLTAAGRVSVERYRYDPVTEAGKRDEKARASTRWNCVAESSLAISHQERGVREPMRWHTAGESEALFVEIGNMQPSRSSLDRLSKALPFLMPCAR